MPCMDNVAATPFEALWAALSAFLGFLGSAVAAHPLVFAVGILYVAGSIYFGFVVGRASAREMPPRV